MNPSLPVRRPLSRGQALVMAALGMMLVTLMVCMTLSFGTKAKAKMELQIVADQAAYSTSVAVARTFNVLALTNRVTMAHMTAMLGIQSAISFSSIWYGILFQLMIYYPLEIANQLTMCNPCPWCPLCPLAIVVAAMITFTRVIPVLLEFIRLMGLYYPLDTAAALQANSTGTAAMMLYLGQTDAVMRHLHGYLDNQNLARRVVNRSAGGRGNFTVPTGNASDVAKREVGFAAGPFAGLVGAINQTNLIASDRHAVMASMGARGHPFTANRASYSILPNSVDAMLRQAYLRVGAVRDITYVNMGNAYFGSVPNIHQNTMLSTNSKLAMADDHGLGQVTWTGPWARRPLRWVLMPVGIVASSPGFNGHLGGFGIVIQVPVGPNPVPVPILVLIPLTPVFHATHRTNAACLLNCPSAWSNFVDYNLLKVQDSDDNNAQPKLPVTVVKDAHTAPRDPFNLFFDFRFTGTTKFSLHSGSMGSSAANSGIWIRDGAGVADISRQLGYSTGIVYYHRADHWAEPPNLFNPYWRGSITRADTDRAANGGDIEDTMTRAGAPWAARAFDSLLANGFKGTP